MIDNIAILASCFLVLFVAFRAARLDAAAQPEPPKTGSRFRRKTVTVQRVARRHSFKK